MAKQVRDVRGIPIWLLKEYLVEGGGIADGDVVTGEGWTVRLEPMEDFEVGSLRIEQVLVTMEGDLDTLLAFFEPKLLRAGG